MKGFRDCGLWGLGLVGVGFKNECRKFLRPKTKHLCCPLCETTALWATSQVPLKIGRKMAMCMAHSFQKRRCACATKSAKLTAREVTLQWNRSQKHKHGTPNVPSTE